MQRPRSLLAVVAAVAALAGCSLPGANPYGSAIEQSDLVTTTPPGSGELDTLAWNLPYEPLSIDAMRSFNYAENTVIANMCESLLRLTPDLRIKPGLAERVDKPDQLTQVYTLRSGVSFWDGNPMTAADVAYSLNRQLDPDNGSVLRRLLRQGRLDRSHRTARGHRAVQRARRPVRAGHGDGRRGDLREGVHRASRRGLRHPATGVMCTGPFKFDSWQPGRDLALVRNTGTGTPRCGRTPSASSSASSPTNPLRSTPCAAARSTGSSSTCRPPGSIAAARTTTA